MPLFLKQLAAILLWLGWAVLLARISTLLQLQLPAVVLIAVIGGALGIGYWPWQHSLGSLAFGQLIVLVTLLGLALALAEHYWSWHAHCQQQQQRRSAAQEKLAQQPQFAPAIAPLISDQHSILTWSQFMTPPPDEFWSTLARWFGLGLSKILVANVVAGFLRRELLRSPSHSDLVT